MAVKKNARRARSRRIPIVFKILALCVLALIALLVLLPAPPDLDAGGVTQVAKHVPERRDAADAPDAATPPLSGGLAVAPETADPPPAPDRAPESGDAAESTAAPDPAAEPQTPAVNPAPVASPATATIPEPESQPDVAATSQPVPPSPIRKPGGAQPPASPEPEQQNAPTQTLPWQIPGDTAGLPPEQPPESDGSGGDELPSASAINSWVKSQAWEFLGGVDAQGNILYRFEVWLEAPQNELKAIKSVAYEYDAPSATPKSRETDRANGGFRVRFGSLACAKEITITLTMADGRKQRVKVDGCQVLN